MKTTIRTLLTSALVLLFASPAFATDFSVLANTSNASFTSNAVLETITGTTAELSGTITTDLANPSATTGSVMFPTNSLRTGVDMRDEHLHGGDWLNAAENPNISFTLDSVTAPDGAQLAHGQAVEVTVSGTMTIKGTTQQITAPATVTYYIIDDEELAGTYGIESNVLRIQASFTISLEDYGVNIPAPLRTKVSNEIEVTVRLTATEQA